MEARLPDLGGGVFAPESGGGADLIELVDSVPESSCLLHGDLHAANVIVLHGELSIIDVETAGYGSPLFDLALSRANIMYSIKAEDAMGLADEEALGKVRNAMWRTILEGYFEDAGEDELAEIDAKLERLAIYRRFQF